MLLVWMWKSGRQCLDYRFSPLVACKLAVGGAVALAASWWIPQVGPRLLTVALRSAVCLTVYAVVLYGIEEEFRVLGRFAYGRIVHR